MLEMIDLFREKGTLDELGFGSIRDSFADHFFPGISTIQTRARYLLFVPWVYRTIEREGLPYSQVEKRAREIQGRLARALSKGGEGDAQGVIGIQAGEALQRTPSSIYRSALRKFGIWRFPGTLAQYYAVLRRMGSAVAPIRSDDGELVEGARAVGWHAELPKEPSKVFESASFDLSYTEADYLRERIAAETPGSLLVRCLNGSQRINRIDFPWEHPDMSEFPQDLRLELDQAHRFSFVAHGALLLYHLLLSEKASELGLLVPQELVDSRRELIDAWALEAQQQRTFLRRWRMADLWSVVMNKGHRISAPTCRFVEAIVGIMSEDPTRFPNNEGAKRLVVQRELALKGGLARLTHRRALERSPSLTAPGQLTYRWSNAKRIVRDIQLGLTRRPGAAEESIA